MLKKNILFLKTADPCYGQFVFGEKENKHYVMASYRPETGLFELWYDSADTDFKRIYKGNLYILKGAMEEYYGYFDLPSSGRGKAAGSYRSIDFEEDLPLPILSLTAEISCMETHICHTTELHANNRNEF